MLELFERRESWRLTRSFARLLDFFVLHVEVLEVSLSIFEEQTIEDFLPSFSERVESASFSMQKHGSSLLREKGFDDLFFGSTVADCSEIAENIRIDISTR